MDHTALKGSISLSHSVCDMDARVPCLSLDSNGVIVVDSLADILVS